MKATGLYTLDGSTAVDWELQAYAAALDMLCDDLKQLQKESFAAGAEDYGLRCREAELGILWPAHTVEERQKMICTLGAVSPNDCSKAALEKLLTDLGFTAQITEDLAKRKLTIAVTQEPYGDTDAWEEIIGRYFPAHLNAAWDYTGMTNSAQT